MNFDEKVFRYEPQIPKAFSTIDTVHIWKDRMRQWREIMWMEKQSQFQFHSQTNSPLKVVGWESPKCWEDEPIIVWLKPSHYIRKKKNVQNFLNHHMLLFRSRCGIMEFLCNVLCRSTLIGSIMVIIMAGNDLVAIHPCIWHATSFQLT